MKQYLTEIELPIWTDPQSDVILEKSRNYCHLYFNCWVDRTDKVNHSQRMKVSIAKQVLKNDSSEYKFSN